MNTTLSRLRAGLLGGLLALATAGAQAHKPSDAYLNLRLDGPRIEARLDVALRDLDRDLVLDTDDDGQLRWREVRTRWAEIQALAWAGVRLQADGSDCRVVGGLPPPQLDEHSDGSYAVLRRSLECAAPVRRVTIGYTLFQHSDPTHRGIVRLRGAGAGGAAGGEREAVLTPGAAATTMTLQGGAPSGVLAFVGEGVHHIASGIDHILFLMALLLPSVLVRTAGGWRAAPDFRRVLFDVLRVVTAFTVAHSITLALAVFDIVDPPTRLVESAIAASVVVAALNNVWPIVRERRWAMAFVFGLMHGFGFASGLKDLGLGQGSLVAPLFGFNLGVELGQAAIVLLFLPLAWTVRRRDGYRRGVLAAGSLAIAALATVWLVERAANVQIIGLA